MTRSKLWNMKDLRGAKEHYGRALEIFRNRMRGKHPSTVTVRNNLAALE